MHVMMPHCTLPAHRAASMHVMMLHCMQIAHRAASMLFMMLHCMQIAERSQHACHDAAWRAARTHSCQCASHVAVPQPAWHGMHLARHAKTRKTWRRAASTLIIVSQPCISTMPISWVCPTSRRPGRTGRRRGSRPTRLRRRPPRLVAAPPHRSPPPLPPLARPRRRKKNPPRPPPTHLRYLPYPKAPPKHTFSRGLTTGGVG
jgi:hypothetical protein